MLYYMSDSRLYTRLLLPKGHGYPLFHPQPYEDLPLEARRVGIEIGDVGVLTSDGSFDVIFNICRSADDPGNRFGVPEGFEQIELDPAKDIASRPRYHRPGCHVSNSKITKRRLGVDAGVESNVFVPLGAGAVVEISTSSKETAVLLLPDGASRTDLRRNKKFRDYALKHALFWYAFVNGDLERIVDNGDLYLVTGIDKTSSWSLAAVENHSEGREMSLKLKAAQVGSAATSCAWEWESASSFADSGPRPLPEDDDRIENQTVFLRGFKVAISFSRLKKSVKAISIVDSKPSDILSKPGGSPFPQSRLSNTSSFFRGSAISRSGGPSDDGPSIDASAEFFPRNFKAYHPAFIINEYLLNCSPADVAVTHDDDWLSVLNEHDKDFPDDHELIKRISKKFKICTSSGGVWLDNSSTEISSRTALPEAVIPLGRHEISEDPELAGHMGPSGGFIEHSPSSPAYDPVLEPHEHLWHHTPANVTQILKLDNDSQGEDISSTSAEWPAACVRCQELQVKCEFKMETNRCQRCFNDGHDCMTGVRASDAREDPPRSFPSPTPTLRRALLIGVETCKTEGYPELKRAHEDVYKLRDLLLDTYHYGLSDITILLDDGIEGHVQPTRINILAAIEELVKDVKEGDQILFSYSGHSSRIYNSSLGEEDGINTCLIPVDGEDSRIVDDELHASLVRPLPRGSHLVAVLDTRFSGSLLDLKHYRCNRVVVPWTCRGKRNSDEPSRLRVRRLSLPQTSDPASQTGDVASSKVAHITDCGPIGKSEPLASIRAGSTAMKGSLSRLRRLSLPQTSGPAFQTDDAASLSGIGELAPTNDSGLIRKSGPLASIRAGSAAIKRSLGRLHTRSLSLLSATKDKDIDRNQDTDPVPPALPKLTWILPDEDLRCESPAGLFTCTGWCRHFEGSIDEDDEVKTDVISLASCRSHEWDTDGVTMVSVGIYSVSRLADLQKTRRCLLISSGRIPTGL
ncbi:caspase domain-containing protein [Mycena galopus ATCC 62051]|nr:caspase domain-containing protein [Mycena galopus ATCC 62051]